LTLQDAFSYAFAVPERRALQNLLVIRREKVMIVERRDSCFYMESPEKAFEFLVKANARSEIYFVLPKYVKRSNGALIANKGVQKK
jgi:hypothetical protein